MIDEHHEELAAMYVLGIMEPGEMRAFEEKMRANPELCKFVDDLLHSSAALVHAVPAKSAPSHLKEKVLRVCASKPAESVVGKAGEESKVVPFRRAPFPWLPWAIAAGFMVMCGWLFSDRTKLLAQISDLEGKSDVCQIQLALLNPTVERPSRAYIMWDASTQTGMLEGDNMPRPAANEDYQLWVLDDQYPQPVDAGVITVDEKGKVKAPFKPKQKVSATTNFAVTLEKKGGMPQPQGTMVMKSNEK